MRGAAVLIEQIEGEFERVKSECGVWYKLPAVVRYGSIMKILIAEDDTTSRLLFSATLRKLGHTVTAVEDGHEAWKAWQQGEYPLLISDWMMPNIDGLQLCRMIRGEPGLQYTYVILLTSLDSKGGLF